MACLFTPYYWAAFLPAFLMGSLLLLSRLPEAGYYAIVLLVPFGAYRNIGGEGADLKLHWIIAAMVTAILLLRHMHHKDSIRGISSRLWPFLLLIGIISFISNLYSPYPETAFGDLLRFALGLVFFILGMALINEKGLRTWLPLSLVGGVSIGSLLAVIGYFFHVALFASDVDPGQFTRGTGASIGSNNVALMIIFVFPLLVDRMLYAKTALGRLLAIALILLNSAGLMTTYSRGGALIFTAIVLTLLVRHRALFTPRRMGLFIAGAGTLCVMALAVVPQDYWDRQLSLIEHNDRAINRRTSYIMVAWETIKENPVLGSGMGTFRKIYGKSPVSRTFNLRGLPEERYAHNTYLELAVGTGFTGLAVFLGLLICVLSNFSKAGSIYAALGQTRMASLTRSYRLCFIAMLLYFLIKSAFEHKFFFVILAASQVALNLALQAQVKAQFEAQPSESLTDIDTRTTGAAETADA